MNLTLRAKLRLPEGCSDEELQQTCSKYYAIYKGVADSAVEESVRAVAISKLEDLIASAQAENVALDQMGSYNWRTQNVESVTAVEQELAKLGTGSTLPESKVKELNEMIRKLPDSAKRHYLSALVTLRSTKATVETYKDVINKLKYAQSSDPQNPVYPAMMNDIAQEINSYTEDYNRWAEERRIAIEKETRIQNTKRFFSGLGSVLLWIGGALLTIGGGIVACLCSSCDAC